MQIQGSYFLSFILNVFMRQCNDQMYAVAVVVVIVVAVVVCCLLLLLLFWVSGYILLDCLHF